ncbi:MAG: hypothetical protein ACO3RV_04520 [Luteolibacter sp.]
MKFEESSRSLKSGKTTQTAREFEFEPVFDLYSAMLFVRQQRLSPGDRVALVVHPFKTPYLVRVRVIARERHMERPAIRHSGSMQKIDAKTMKLKAYKKLHREATLRPHDGFRIPLELRAAVFIGDVRATLSSFRQL